MAPYNSVHNAYRPNRPNQPLFAAKPQQLLKPPQSQQLSKPSESKKFAVGTHSTLIPTQPPTSTSYTLTAPPTIMGPSPIEGGYAVGAINQRFNALGAGIVEQPSMINVGQYRDIYDNYNIDGDNEYRFDTVSPQAQQQQQQQQQQLDQLIQSGITNACNLSSTAVFDKNKYPWIVSIGSNNIKPIKTGILIHPKWILTVQDFLNINIKDYIVKIGGINLDNNSEFTIRSVINDVKHSENRIELLQLNADVTNIKPVSINKNNIQSNGIEVGWGTLAGNVAKTLHELNIPILNNNICKTVFQSKFKDYINICGGYPECKNLIPCVGDTGDPLLFNVNGEYMLEGISEYHLNCEVRSGLGSWIKISNLIPWLLQYIPDLINKQIISNTLAPSTILAPSITTKTILTPPKTILTPPKTILAPPKTILTPPKTPSKTPSKTILTPPKTPSKTPPKTPSKTPPKTPPKTKTLPPTTGIKSLDLDVKNAIKTLQNLVYQYKPELKKYTTTKNAILRNLDVMPQTPSNPKSHITYDFTINNRQVLMLLLLIFCILFFIILYIKMK